ncbi:MAG: hypothetical protein ABFD84_16290 [Candidatus Polarisedimenticolia bacterium]
MMLSWSSLSRTSHFRSAGTTMRRQRSGRVPSQASSPVPAPDISEKRANWLTIRSSSDGGSRKTTNGDAAPRASSCSSVRASAASISVVKTSDPSRASAFRSAGGRQSCARTWSRHQSTPSTP